MKNFIKNFIVLLLFWGNSTVTQAFQATVNRTEIPQGETFLLTLETDNDKSKQTPDLSVLDKDFKVYSVGNAFQSSYVNGVTSHSRQWQIVLMPKREGKIEIPAIKYGNEVSDPIQLNVVSSSLAKQIEKGNNIPEFAVDAEIDNKNPFVQQQIIYTYKLYDSGGLYGDAPSILDDGSNDWIVKGLGEPIINRRVINGKTLREIEFKYALFPQKSGKLKTPEIIFKGYYVTENTRNKEAFERVFNQGFVNMDFHGMFATRNPVTLKADPIIVDVKPVPETSNKSWWLPASKVSLTAEWNDKNPVFRVGEAIGISVYLKAVGVIENQLPDIKFNEIDGVKQYPEKPVTMGSKNNDNIISIKKFSNVFIPEKPGKIIIPELSVSWYNVKSRQLEKAILPAQTIMVLPASGSSDINKTEEEIAEPEETLSPQPIPAKEKEVQNETKEEKILPIGILLLLTFILGVIVSWFFFGRNKEKNLTVKDYIKEVEASALSGNIKDLRNVLLEWARSVYNQSRINNLDEIKKYDVSSAFQEQLNLISKVLYSDQKEKFNAKEFIRIFREEQKHQKKQAANKLPLPKLYK